MSVAQHSQVKAPRTIIVDSCPMCKRKDSLLFFSAPDRLHGVPGIFTYKRCNSCHTVFQNPKVRPEDLEICYPLNYFTHTIQRKLEIELSRNGLDEKSDPPSGFRSIRDNLREAIKRSVQGIRSPNDRWGLLGNVMAKIAYLRKRAFYNLVSDELLPRTPNTPKALEIGCGTGHMLVKLQSVGWETEGVEWAAQAASLARKISGRPVWAGDFRTVSIPLSEYDLIYMHHVFEHIDDPNAALLRIYDLLASGGRAVIIYPNPKSLGAKIYGDSWFPWEVPRHLVIPPAKAVMNVAKQMGFNPLKLSVSAKDAAYYFALSRAYKLSKPANEFHPDINTWDTLLGLVEKFLIKVIPSLGEEITLVLGKK